MDSVLLDYLRSGRAWVLVGSGPSSAMGYPSWRVLAEKANSLVRQATANDGLAGRLDSAMADENYPRVFEIAADELGIAALIRDLRPVLRPQLATGDVYAELARWPIPVYLTTNFDNELITSVVRVDPTYRSLSNSEDHLSLLVPGFSGAVVKLHGDLTTPMGLVLTESQYSALLAGSEWEYWRTKVRSILQMNPLIIVGQSLTDPHVTALLEEAKHGSGVEQPVVWLAPDIALSDARGYLDKYRIHVVPYQNRDGTHRNLATFVKDIGRFVPPRSTVATSARVAAVVSAGAVTDAGAPAFYVFNRLNSQPDAIERRIQVALATIEVALPNLLATKAYSLHDILEVAGWPAGVRVAPEFERIVVRRATSQHLLVRQSDDSLKPGPRPPKARREEFEHLRERFLSALRLRLARDFPDLIPAEVDRIAQDVHDSLTGFFKSGGLTLASILFNPDEVADSQTFLPSSIVAFMSDASARYDAHLLRQAFVHVSLAIFVDAGVPERAFLGRLSQGFFAFHALGAFGEVALERLRAARDTVWLLDSNVQIPVLALAAPSNMSLAETMKRLKMAGIRIFSTQKLFDETIEHLRYADRIVQRAGPDSYDVVAAANALPPYRRQNQFLQGFIRWQEAGSSSDWNHYLFESIGHRRPANNDLAEAARRLGIHVVDFQDWPGFTELDFSRAEQFTQELKDWMRDRGTGPPDRDYEDWLDKKARPEAEAYLVITKEREGSYNAITNPPGASEAWFISSTSAINVVGRGRRVTWQPDAFLEFANTLLTEIDGTSADRAFETLLWSLAQSGASPVDERTIGRVFGKVIDSSRLSTPEERETYQENLEAIYGESEDAVLARLPPSRKILATLQIKNQIIQRQASDLRLVQDQRETEARRAKEAETALDAVAKYKRRVADRQARIAKRRRKSGKRPR